MAETWGAGTTWGQGVTWGSVSELPYYPVPPGRGRWRLTLNWRRLMPVATQQSTMIAELLGARSRILARTLNNPAQLTFSIDGRSQCAMLLEELACEVWALRWNTQTGMDDLMFAGPVTNTEDELSEDVHTVSVTCQDYGAVLKRRFLTAAYSVATTADQDNVIGDLAVLGGAASAYTTGVTPLANTWPGAFLPVTVALRNRDGTTRTALTGQQRTRNYDIGQGVFDALDALRAVQGGFDWDIEPENTVPPYTDWLRVFYPSQGVERLDYPLVYGWNVSSLTRTVNSSDYANWETYIGQSTDGTSPPPTVSVHDATVTDQCRGAPGLWMNATSAADVSVSNTLLEQAQGALNIDGVLVPSYTLTLRANAWDRLGPAIVGDPSVDSPGIHMGDTVPLVVKSGRLDVESAIRVMGITWTVGDDGDEQVALTVGRPDTTLTDFFAGANRRLSALERR